MAHSRVALFVTDRDDSRAFCHAFASHLGFEALVPPRRPSLAQVVKAAPDFIVFDCDAAVPTQWVQLLQEIKEQPLFEATPMLIASKTHQLPPPVFELSHVGHLAKPFTFEQAVGQLKRLGLSLSTAWGEPSPLLPAVERRRAEPPPRPKSDKFRILDTPSLLEADLKNGAGRLGCAVLYLDIDHFKSLNTKHLEREVDRAVLAPFQRLLTELVAHNGHVYAEGGDEVIILLPNASERMALAFADAVLERIGAAEFFVRGERVQLTVSIGLATAGPADDVSRLADAANAAKREAKQAGRNRVALAPRA